MAIIAIIAVVNNVTTSPNGCMEISEGHVFRKICWVNSVWYAIHVQLLDLAQSLGWSGQASILKKPLIREPTILSFHVTIV